MRETVIQCYFKSCRDPMGTVWTAIIFMSLSCKDSWVRFWEDTEATGCEIATSSTRVGVEGWVNSTLCTVCILQVYLMFQSTKQCEKEGIVFPKMQERTGFGEHSQIISMRTMSRMYSVRNLATDCSLAPLSPHWAVWAAEWHTAHGGN